MTHQTFDQDPQPELPAAFSDAEKVAKLAGKEPLSLAAPRGSGARPGIVPCGLASSTPRSGVSEQHGRLARVRRGRWSASASPLALKPLHVTFLGDGLAWNWSIQQAHFPDFIPILDFVHPLEYLYTAASVLAGEAQQIWKCYLAMARACWQGRVDEVTSALRKWLADEGIDAEHPLAEDDSRRNDGRGSGVSGEQPRAMDYPRYRRLGLPVTSSLDGVSGQRGRYRVKGTEKFWNGPSGAEAILQVRAAAPVRR